MRSVLILILSVLFFNNALSEVSVKIQLNSHPNETTYLGYFYDGKTYTIDTLNTDEKSFVEFKLQAPISGTYFFITGETSKDFIISDSDSLINIEAENSSNDSFRFSGSLNNQLQSDYTHFLKEQLIKIQKLKAKDLETRLQKLKITQSINAYADSVSNKYPNELVVKYWNASKEKKMLESTNQDSVYTHFIQHYWDFYDFSEPAFVRSRILKKDLDFLYNEVLYQKPYFLVKQIDQLIAKSDTDGPLYNYLVKYFYNKYSSSKIMGLDSVYVHIAEKYILNKENAIVSSKFAENLKERVEALKPNLIGKVAPNIENTLNYDSTYVSLHDLKADYTLVLFWNTNCGHCKKEMPVIKNICEDLNEQYNLKVYAFYTHDNTQEWRRFIEDEELFDWVNTYDRFNNTGFRKKYNVYKTPILYILDKDKKIIAKNISSSQIEDVLKNQ